MQRSPIPNSLSQMSPLSLVTHGSSQNPHHRLIGGHGLPGIVPHDIEQRMLEYLKLFQPPKDLKRELQVNFLAINNFNFFRITIGPQSPPEVSRETMNALEMSRMALWNMYNNSSPHNQHNNSNPSPPEVQQEALNLQRESPSPIPAVSSSPISIKRERDHSNEVNDYHVPPAKRGLIRTNSDLTSRKTPINNNNNNNNHLHHHHLNQHISNNISNNNNNNNQHVTPTKDIGNKRSESPQNISENGNNHHHNLQSPVRHHKQNGFDSLGTTFLNGMQFKIISKGMSH